MHIIQRCLFSLSFSCLCTICILGEALLADTFAFLPVNRLMVLAFCHFQHILYVFVHFYTQSFSLLVGWYAEDTLFVRVYLSWCICVCICVCVLAQLTAHILISRSYRIFVQYFSSSSQSFNNAAAELLQHVSRNYVTWLAQCNTKALAYISKFHTNFIECVFTVETNLIYFSFCIMHLSNAYSAKEKHKHLYYIFGLGFDLSRISPHRMHNSNRKCWVH